MLTLYVSRLFHLRLWRLWLLISSGYRSYHWHRSWFGRCTSAPSVILLNDSVSLDAFYCGIWWSCLLPMRSCAFNETANFETVRIKYKKVCIVSLGLLTETNFSPFLVMIWSSTLESGQKEKKKTIVGCVHYIISYQMYYFHFRSLGEDIGPGKPLSTSAYTYASWWETSYYTIINYNPGQMSLLVPSSRIILLGKAKFPSQPVVTHRGLIRLVFYMCESR